MSKNPTVTKPSRSLASVSQIMLYDDFKILPVVADGGRFLGSIHLADILAHLKEMQEQRLPTFSEQLTSHLRDHVSHYSFTIEPSMVDSTGNLSQGVLTEYLKDISVRVLTKKQQKNVIIEQMMLYFLQAVQIDDDLQIYAKIIRKSRKNASLDFEVFQGRQLVSKAIVMVKLN